LHQANDTLARALDASHFEHGMNAQAAVDLTVFQEDLLDVGAQAGIFSAMLARLSTFPGKIATL
jgi:hypothetical protein